VLFCSANEKHISSVKIDAELFTFFLIVLSGTVKTGLTRALFLELIQQPLSALLNWYCQGKLARRSQPKGSNSFWFFSCWTSWASFSLFNAVTVASTVGVSCTGTGVASTGVNSYAPTTETGVHTMSTRNLLDIRVLLHDQNGYW